MNFITSIIDWIKGKFNIDVEDKNESEYETDFDETSKISLTSILAERTSTLTLLDSSVSIVGDNQRAKYINQISSKLWVEILPKIANVCLGTGDCLVKCSTDGKRFGFDIVENGNFRIVESMGDFVYAMLIMCDEMKTGRHTYQRWEYHKLNEVDGISYETITQVCFKDDKSVPIESIAGWDNIKEYVEIANVDRLLLGRFKSPKLNRDDYNSTTGVPITYGADEVVEEAKKAWRRYNKEMEDKETMIFANKRLFKSRRVTYKNASGTSITEDVSELPKGKDRIIYSVNNEKNVGEGGSIDIFSPDIRDTSLDNAIERNLKMLEMTCGLSEGLLSKSSMTYTNTDEIKKSLQATYSFITIFRKVLEQGMNDLLYAVDKISTYNEVTPMGNWIVDYDWSDSYVESMTERFNQLLQANGMNVISDAELRAWTMDEDVAIAQEHLDEMKTVVTEVE